MQQQQFEEDDVHICGLCKTRFSDVEVFIHHKKFGCIVRLARQREETHQKTADLVKEIISKSQGNNVVELSDGQTVGQDGTSLPATDIIELTCSSPDLIRPVSLHANKSCFPSTIDDLMEVETGSTTREASYNRQPQFTGTEQDQADCVPQGTVCYSQGNEYILLPSGSTTNQYNSQVNQSEGLKEQDTSLQSYALNSHQPHTGNQTSLTSQSILQSVNENIFLLNKGLVSEDSTPQASQLPVFVSREITENASEDTLSVQIEESGPDTAPSIRYTLTFEESQGQTVSQQVSAASISNITISPKISYSLDTQQKSLNETQGKAVSLKTEHKSKKDASVDNKKMKRPLEKKYACQTCHYKTAYLKDLERHSRIHTGERPYQCEECPKAFNRSDKLALHMKYHQNDRSFKCELCEYSAVEKSSLRKHMTVHFDERPYECQVCPYKARSASQLQIHLRVHTGDTPYQCKDCGAFFKVNSDLKRHARIHSGEKPFKCYEPDCDYKCAIKGNLRSHMKTNHSSDTQLGCDICEYKTSSKRALFEHKKIHEVNTDLICLICNYQCSNRSALRNHMKIHNNDRFKCNYCSYTSFQSGNVQAHMKRKHSSKMGKSRKLKTESHSRQGLDGILESGRGSCCLGIRTKCQQNYKCDQCEAAFVREDSLRCHLKQHTDSPLSTAYAVLKLQNPVINSSTTANVTGSVTHQPLTSQAKNQSTILQPEKTIQNPLTIKENPQIILDQGGIQNQTANLGINDILAAARLSGLTSSGNSPTLNKPLEQFIFQEGSDVCSTYATENAENQTITISQPQQQDLSGVHVMQNISLPYMRLPNGQILLLTGQNSTPVVHQSSIVASEETLSTNQCTTTQTQIIAQQPTSEQEQIIHIPEPSVSSSVSTISTPQSGAIPIQIILPNDSQQAIPLVTQLLNSFINRGTSEVVNDQMIGQTTTIGHSNSKEVDESTQNFVVQIPAQSGTLKDPTGAPIAEPQSFLLQIPSNESFS